MTTISTSGGEFEFAVYAPYNSSPDEPVGGRINVGVDTALWFRADRDSDNVRLVQLIRPQGQWINDRERERAANGWSLDSNSVSPWYGTNDLGAPRPIRDLTPNITPQLRDWIKQSGVQTLSGAGSRRGKGYQRAWIVDTPRQMAARVGELVQVRLVTIAVDVQHSAYLGRRGVGLQSVGGGRGDGGVREARVQGESGGRLSAGARQLEPAGRQHVARAAGLSGAPRFECRTFALSSSVIAASAAWWSRIRLAPAAWWSLE